MVRYYEQTMTLNYSWEQVAQAFWQRYPNPQSSHVLTEDTSVRRVSGDRLHSTRLLTKTNRVPRWGECLLGSSSRTVPLQEDSVCDRRRRSLATVTRNLAHQHLIGATECVEYTPHPQQPHCCTLVKRSVKITSPVFGLGYALQALGVERFKKNIQSTHSGFEFVLNRMFPHSEKLVSPTPAIFPGSNRIRQTAKKATELARSHAGGMVAACAPEKQT